DGCWASLSRTSRTARSRTSGENLFVVLLMMLHPTQELEPPANPERFTDHNRWYVERKFVRLCNSEMDDNLAKRLVVRLHVEGKTSVCRKISHLEKSIDFDRSKFHERLVKALADLCS
ncbi:MAG: hypothetical protein NXI16_16445, partial [Alphaproteobacteria bacterium]|nr:hypothetical protein [Alphaproteobacteria bacterium]